jgi:hypothetical protein
MGKESGLNHFGHRLGYFMTQLAIVFRPRTVGLSGGFIARYWQQLEKGVEVEFHPSHMTRPDIVVQKDDEPALRGLATLFCDKKPTRIISESASGFSRL